MVVVVLRAGRSGCSLKVIIVVSYRWGSESEAFALQSRTAAAAQICSCTCYIGSCVENSATDIGTFVHCSKEHNLGCLLSDICDTRIRYHYQLDQKSDGANRTQGV
jgi:hypothetical protein